MSVHSITFSKYQKKKVRKKKLFPPYETVQAQLPGQHANQKDLRHCTHQWPTMMSSQGQELVSPADTRMHKP